MYASKRSGPLPRSLTISPTWRYYAALMIQLLPWNEDRKCEAVPSFYTYKLIFYSHQERSTEEHHHAVLPV